MSLHVPGVVDWDLRRREIRVASCAGVVRQVCMQRSQTVTKGDVVLKLESEAAIAAQERFIDALAAFAVHCDRAQGDAVFWARQDLRRLKFTPSQIKRIETGRRVLRQLPILSPWTGLVTDIVRRGRTVGVGAPLFAVATHTVVLCEAPADLPDEAFAGLGVAREKGAPSEHCGEVQIERDRHGNRRVYFDLRFPSFAPPVGAQVEVKPPPPAPPAPEPPPLLLRGLEYRLQKRAEDPCYEVVPARACVPVSPEDEERDAQRLRLRAGWRTAAFDVELGAALGDDEGADLVLDAQAWRLLAVETEVARETVFAPAWRLWGVVDAIRPRQRTLDVHAPGDGWFEPEARAGDVLSAGAVLARLRREDDDAPWPPLVAPGAIATLAERALAHVAACGPDRQIELAQRCVVRLVAERGRVRAGALLARLRAARWSALRCVLAPTLAAALPAHARVRIETQADKTLVTEFRAALWRVGALVAYAPLPESAAGWRPGVGYDVTLIDDAAAYSSLGAPADCVVHLGAATEVLAHIGPGRLARRAVKLGAARDGLVEILSGVTAGAVLVRHLADRMRWFPRFQAAMIGVWSPPN